ncbi:TPA: ead/Ea22-like family protein [Citrobacter freundii]|nr:ead/Ea22-like family protein [Citrobacter freundii]
MTNKQALREAAEKATPGEWRRASTRFNGITAQSAYPLCGKEDILASAAEKRDAEFIAAANPATVLTLLDELEAAEKRIAELEARTVTLPPLNDDLIAILGRPNFTCSHLAELMRKSGDEIRRKSEHEQAAVIHWFLGIYLEHGDKWEGIAKADIQSRVAAAGIGVKGE